MRKFFSEFKTFALRGNVIDLAVGVIVGGAFSSITTSLINDILRPILGIFTIFTSQISFADLTLNVGGAVIAYGSFIQAVLNFLVMAFIVFCLVRFLNRLHKQAPKEPPKPSNQELLLAEIRDLLKEERHG